MSRFYYDLHTHSCLSPCADGDNTPNNLAGMAKLNGINILALTDHNSCKNCPAFFTAARRYGIVPVAGMELTTAEDIHLVCLFERMEDALAFDRVVDAHRTPFKNRPDIFGEQLILNGEDEVTGIEENFLPIATDLVLEQAFGMVTAGGGICYPAHIDREANGMIAVLGAFPEAPPFSCAELHESAAQAEYTEKYGLAGKRFIVSSDAHYLTDLREENDFFELDAPSGDETAVRRRLFEGLRGEK